MSRLALNFDLVTADQIEQAIAIESEGTFGDICGSTRWNILSVGFPPDEAASLESFRSVSSYEDY